MTTVRSFFLHNKTHRRLWVAALVSTLIQWILFKQLYPYPDFFSDSYSYMEAAATHATVNIWPIGYSWFLRLVHNISWSATVLVTLQYFLLIAGELVLFFTLLHFYQPNRTTRRLLWVFFFCNPLLLYVSNYVSSDSLFTALSLLWFTQLLWIIHRPVWYQVITHAVLLALAFCVRYNALYYPLIAAVALFLCRLPKVAKWGGLALSLLLIAGFIRYTGSQAKALTGTRQFSVFSGWQLGNNALYVYPHLKIPLHVFSGKAGDFNRRTVKPFFDTCHPAIREISPIDGAFFIRMPTAPLKRYYADYIQKNKPRTDFEAWGGVSPVFSDFGSTIIKNYPFAYTQYYLLPNSVNYFLPPLEKLEVYNIGIPQVLPVAQYWFRYKTPYIYAKLSPQFQGLLLFVFPPFFLVLNIGFVLYFIALLVKRKKWQLPLLQWQYFLLAGALFIANAAFSILASPVVLRYQVFAMLVLFSFAAILAEIADRPKPIATAPAVH